MTRLVFLDVDGTLIDGTQTVPDSAKRALSQAIDAGHKLFISSGRVPPEIYPFLWDLGFDGIVAANGAYVESGDHTIVDEPMDVDQVKTVAATLERFGAYAAWQNPDAVYATKDFLDSLAALTGQTQGDWSAYFSLVGEYLRDGVPATCSKCTFTLPAFTGKSLNDVIEALGEQFCIVAGSFTGDVGTTGEIVRAGISKASGLRAVAAHYGLPIDQTVAVGDSANDVDILKAAGVGIAMGNATQQAKDAADWVTSSIHDDGLAQAFEYCGLI